MAPGRRVYVPPEDNLLLATLYTYVGATMKSRPAWIDLATGQISPLATEGAVVAAAPAPVP